MRWHVTILVLVMAYSSRTCLAARILGLFPAPSISHQVVYRAVMEELAKRGHEIVVMTPDPVHYEDKQFENITEIDLHDISYGLLAKSTLHAQGGIGKERNVAPKLNMLAMYLADLQLGTPEMKALLENKEEHFDLIFVETFVSINFVAAARFNAPVIGISSALSYFADFLALGNPTHPVLYADIFSRHAGELDFWQRLERVYEYVVLSYQNWAFSGPFNEIARKHYGADTPTVEEAQRRMSMLFINAHPILSGIRPVVPGVVYLGGSHLKPKQPLPKDLKQFLDESKRGVVYMSLGSNVKSKDLSTDIINTFIEAFRELPYNVLWKFENDSLPDKPSNVFISKWLPQNDLLGHPNIKAFITQGGQQSLEEAIQSNVPLIGIPFMADQDHNVDKMVHFGMGIGLNIDTLDVTSLKEAIFEVAENNKYRSSVTHMSALLEDRPKKALESAVWWAEYVMRHGGADHLRAPSVPLYQYLMLDIVAFVVFIVFASVLTAYSFVRYLLKSLFGARKLKRS